MAEQASTREPRKTYSYSWYLPATSTKGEAAAPPPQVMEATEGMEVGGQPDSSHDLLNNQPADVEEPIPLIKPIGRMPNPKKQRYSGVGVLSNRMRFAALAGWTAVSAMGMGALVLLRHGPFPTLQIGELAGVWAGLSLAIFFFTSRFGK